MPDDARLDRLPGPGRSFIQGAFHTVVVASVAYLWFWHLGELIQYVLALPTEFFKWVPRWWRRLVDDFACALFGPVLFVTLSYYGLQFLPLDPLYGEDYQVGNALQGKQPACYSRDICVPAWVVLGMHVGSSVTVILDFMVCIRQRTFSMRAEYGQTVITVGYTLWLMLCKSRTGSFPYPVMEELPMPGGFILSSVFMITSCELLFGFGRRMHLMFMHQRQLGNVEGGFRRDRARLENGDDACPSVDSAHMQMTSSHVRHRLHQNTS
ncbi:hypothetical protein WJX79_010889 [Trebouxia sp. C0005]